MIEGIDWRDGRKKNLILRRRRRRRKRPISGIGDDQRLKLDIDFTPSLRADNGAR
jgi:hypothetical protein